MSDQDEIRIVILNDKKAEEPAKPGPDPDPAVQADAKQPSETAEILGEVAGHAGKIARDVGTVAFNAASKVTTQAWRSDARRNMWDSDQRKEASAKLSAQAQVAAEASKAKSKELLDEAVDRVVKQRIAAEKEKVKTRVQETDWKEVAQHGATSGLRGLSAGLAKLAARLKKPTPPSKPSNPSNPSNPNSDE
jgi:hypothetical protein